MSSPIDRLCDELRIRLNGMDRRLEALKANGSDLSDKSRHLVEAQLDSVHQRMLERRGRVAAAAARLDAARERALLADPGFRDAGDASGRRARAEEAQLHAMAAFEVAGAALDEAAKAALEALLAGFDAGPRPAEPDAPAADGTSGILDVGAGHMHAAQAKWDRLTPTDLLAIRTQDDLVAGVEARYGLPRQQVRDDVASWVAARRFR
jgi:hypothetical protein